MASTSEATNSSNTPNNNNNNTPGAGTDTPPRPPIERPSALFEDVNPYNREASPEAWLRWEMFKHWKGFEQKPMEAVQGWLFVWIPIILVLLLILGPIGWITFVLLIFFYPVLISLVEALILLWCDAHFVMDIIFNPLILWEFFIMTLKILYCKNLVFDPVSSAEGHLEALIHFRIKYVQLKLFFDTYEPRKDIWLRNHFYNLNNQYPKHVMDGLSRAHAKDQSWLWFYSKYAARVIAGIALLSLAAGLTFFFRKSKTMTKWLVGKKKEATIRKTSFFTSFVNVLIAFAGIFTLITGLTDIIDTMKTVLTIFSFGRWMNGQRKRKCTVDRKCCIFHDYTGLIGTLFGCYCDCHEAGDIGLKPDTPLYTPEDGKPATPPLFRKNKGKEPMSDSDDDDEDGFQMFEDEMERIIKKAREARPPRSRFFDYYDGYSAKFYDVFNYIVENPSITSTKVMDRSIPMPLNPERWNNYWRAFIIADMIAQENQYPAKAFERAMDRAAEIARNANKHAQAARKTEVFITYLIIGGTAFLCGLTIYLTYLAIRWATGLSKLEKKYRKLKPKKCDKAENCTDVSKKHRKKFNHPIPHDETTQPPTPPKEVRECRFGGKCKKRSDKDHCAQFNHPKEEAREWGNEPYGRKSKNRTSKGKTKGRANDSTTPKKARFDPADYERSDFALDNKEMKYWQDLKRSLRERPNREDVEDTQRKARDRLEKLEKSFDYAVAGPTAKRMYKRDVALLKTMCNAKFRGNRVTFTDPDDPEFQKVTSKRVIYADSKRKWANDDKRNWGDSDDDEMDFQKDYDDWMKEANKRRPLSEAVKGEMDKAWNKYWASLTKDESMIKILEDCRQAFIDSLPKDHPYRLRPPEAPKPQRVEANVSALRAVTKCWLCDAGHNYWSCPKNRDHHWRMAMGATTLLTEDVKPIKEFGILYNSTKNFFDLEKMRVVKRESHSPENPPVNIDKAVLSLEPVFADIEGEDFVGTGWGTGNYFVSAFHVHTDTPHIKGEALKKAKIDKETEDFLKSLDIILYERPKRVEPAKIDIAEDNSSVHVFGFIDNQLSYGRGYMKRYDHNDAQHSAPTDDGMSGGPIWNSQMTKIIGIHQGTNGRPNDNYGRWFDAKLAGVLRTGRLNA